MEQWEAVCVSKEMEKSMFGRLGEFLNNTLFMEWSRSAVDNERPPVSFPNECLVGKYARTVVYYVAGWTISSASKALTVATKKRAMYISFAKAHSLEMEEAKLRKLPTAVVVYFSRSAYYHG